MGAQTDIFAAPEERLPCGFKDARLSSDKSFFEDCVVEFDESFFQSGILPGSFKFLMREVGIFKLGASPQP
jgi:hypothetical protein